MQSSWHLSLSQVSRFDHVHPAINIVNIYGDQEKGDVEKGKKENTLEGWNRLLQELKDIESRGESVLIIGDMNRGIGTGDWGVEGNKPHVTFGGQLVRDLLSTKKYVLLNNLTLAEGGPNIE